MNRDFVEMLSVLSDAGVEFLIVGAHALAAHDQPRATEDLDIWIRATPENGQRAWRALAAFGAPLDDLTLADLSRPGLTFQVGIKPYRIDILTEISGITFDEAWPNRLTINNYGLTLGVIGKEDLIRNKRATGRTQDQADAEFLEGLEG